MAAYVPVTTYEYTTLSPFCYAHHVLPKLGRLQRQLSDIATFCPLATNTVENSHGHHQNALYKFRGKSKAPAAAAECSVLSSLIHDHSYLKSLVLEETMPRRWGVATMQKRIGRKKGKQPKCNPKVRVLQASTKPKRRISAWNVFLQEKMSKSSLSAAEYKQRMKSLGRVWATMTEQEKETYHVDAQYAQACRDELETRSLTPASAKRDSEQPPELQREVLPPEDQSTRALESIAGVSAVCLTKDLAAFNVAHRSG